MIIVMRQPSCLEEEAQTAIAAISANLTDAHRRRDPVLRKADLLK